jgi:hypothetical protein
MSYFIVRVNTKDHPTRLLAMADMAAIIDRRGYWKMSQRADMPIGSSIIAMGGHGGRGLFLHGIVRGDWRTVKGGAEGNPTYRNKLRMQWENIVYTHDTSAVDQALGIVNLGALRKHSEITKERFRELLYFVMSGEAINPWEYVEEVELSEDDMEVTA